MEAGRRESGAGGQLQISRFGHKRKSRVEEIQGEADREGEEEYENGVGDGYTEGTVDSKSGGQGMENTSKTDSGVRGRDMGRGRVGGGGEIAKRDSKENIRAERGYEQRSGVMRARVVEAEFKKRYDKTQILVEIDKYEAGKTTEESL